MSSIVKYSGLDLDALAEESKKVDAIAGGDYLKIEVGENVYRVLPAPVGRRPIRVTAVHYVDAVPGLEKMVVFTCPRVEIKADCIACAKVDQLNRSKSPIDRERAWKISAQLKVYVNAIDRNNEDAGPRILAFGKTIWEQLKKLRQSKRGGGDFTDPTAAGFDIIIVREGTGARDTRYTVSADRHNSPLHRSPEIAQQWIENQIDLETLIDLEPPNQLLAAWADLARATGGAPARGEGPSAAVSGARTAPRGALVSTQDALDAQVLRSETRRGAVADAKVLDPFDDEPLKR